MPASPIAVVLVNLGTPNAPTAAAVRPYLREFLSDRRVVETHPLIWRPILELMILPRRGKASAEKYASIWGRDGSPLMVNTKAQVEAVAASLPEARVELAMRYGNPGLQSVLRKLAADGYHRVLVVPLYPQYSASSAGTVLDEVYRHGLAARDQLELRTIRSFPTDEGYIRALCAPIERHWEIHGRPNPANGDRLILSYHGIPQAMADDGDPYQAECQATTDAVRARLGVGSELCEMTFQSTFGPAAWLKPATIDTVARLAREGTKRLEIVCPGFTSDCLETLEEIEMLNREAFTEAGGETFSYLPWGNAEPKWTEALTQLVEHNLSGWLSPSGQSASSQGSECNRQP